jgi:hypothetical protein
MNAELQGHADEALAMAGEIKAKDEEMKALAKKRGGEVSKAFDKAKSKEDGLSKELVRLTTVWKNKEEATARDEASLKAAQLSNEQGAKAVAAKEKSIEAMSAEHQKAVDVVQTKVGGSLTSGVFIRSLRACCVFC